MTLDVTAVRHAIRTLRAQEPKHEAMRLVLDVADDWVDRRECELAMICGQWVSVTIDGHATTRACALRPKHEGSCQIARDATGGGA